MFTLKTRSGDANAAMSSMPIQEQLLMWAGVALGVFFSEWVVTRGPDGVDFSLIRVAFAFVISLVIFPSVFSALKSSEDAPGLVKFAIAVQNGAFWSLALDAFVATS